MRSAKSATLLGSADFVAFSRRARHPCSFTARSSATPDGRCLSLGSSSMSRANNSFATRVIFFLLPLSRFRQFAASGLPAVPYNTCTVPTTPRQLTRSIKRVDRSRAVGPMRCGKQRPPSVKKRFPPPLRPCYWIQKWSNICHAYLAGMRFRFWQVAAALANDIPMSMLLLPGERGRPWDCVVAGQAGSARRATKGHVHYRCAQKAKEERKQSEHRI